MENPSGEISITLGSKSAEIRAEGRNERAIQFDEGSREMK